MKRTIRQTAFPILTAFIWGTAFTAQSVGADYVGPLTFNALRSLIAFFALLVLDLAAARLIPGRRSLFQLAKAERRAVLIGGGACGMMLTIASYLQQLGLAETSAGKAGFITAMYIVIVPLFGLFLKRRPTALLWVSVAMAVGGLYLLCVTENLTIAPSDLYVLACAVFFAGHILVVDHFSPIMDGIQMSCVQFLVATVLSGAGMFLFETPTLQAVVPCLGAALYAGLLSSGVGYTLQILAQKDANPTVVSLLLSLESVFAALAGAVLLHEEMGPRELGGCALMLLAVVLAQLPAADPRRREERAAQ